MEQYPVWKILEEDEYAPSGHQTYFGNVLDIPVSDLGCCVVFTGAKLRDGTRLWCMLGNIHLENLRRTRNFLGLSVFDHSEWFRVRRYFDPDFPKNGNKELSKFLNKEIDDIFFIEYEVSSAIGLPNVVRGMMTAEPGEILSDDELLGLMFESSP